MSSVKDKEYILAKVLNHDKGPPCGTCRKPLSGMEIAEDAQPMRKGDLIWFCLFCDVE